MNTRLVFCAPLFACIATLLHADPSEKRTAWDEAPTGFRWNELGPRTTPVPLGDYARVVHVSVATGADDTGDGSRERPWKTLHHALTSHGVADGRVAVLVAAGTYREPTITMASRVDLFGGFDPQGWSRDIHRHATILSGEGRRRVLVGADDSRLDGFIIEDGLARDHGGALVCEEVGTRVTNNVFRRNRVLEPAGFTHNDTRRRQRGVDGGAIALLNAADADIRHNLFHDNETGVGYGGAIVARDDCMPIIAHNVFWANRAGTTDRAETASGNGGAVGLLFSSRAAVFCNLFVGNEALGGSDGGAFHCEYFCWPEVRYNAFLANRAGDDGGAVDNQKFSYPKFHANLFYGNEAGGSGAAMHMDDSLADLMNCIFAFNRAGRQGGGFGGTHGWYRAFNNTVAYNQAGRDGGGLHLVNTKNPFLRPSLLRNNIFAFNTPDQVLIDEECADAAYNNMHPGGYRPGYYNDGNPPGFHDDTLRFRITSVRRAPASFTTELQVAAELEPGTLVGRIVRCGEQWTMVRDNTANAIELWGLLPEATAGELEIVQTFHLAPDSPAISSGTYPDHPPVDIDGEPRYGPSIEVGADEFHAAP